MIGLLLIFFLIFPFTQIIPLASYNQPYAFLTAALIHLIYPKIWRKLPFVDRNFLLYLAIFGTILLAISTLGKFEFREIQYWLSYVSPLIIVPAVYFAMQSNLKRARLFLEVGILIWISVSLIQSIVNVEFLTFLASKSDTLAINVRNSGRGVLSLAPEPTHHGFHVATLAISLFLIGGKRWVVALGIMDVLLLAQSSSALIALTVGALIWAAMRPWRWPYLLALYLSFEVVPKVIIFVVGTEGRLGRLANTFATQGFNFLLEDYSAD